MVQWSTVSVVFEGLKFDNKLHFKDTRAFFFVSGTKHNEENPKNIVFVPIHCRIVIFGFTFLQSEAQKRL